MNYFVTGASGFIGKRLVRELLARPDAKVYFLMRDPAADRVETLRKFWGVDGSPRDRQSPATSPSRGWAWRRAI